MRCQNGFINHAKYVDRCIGCGSEPPSLLEGQVSVVLAIYTHDN